MSSRLQYPVLGSVANSLRPVKCETLAVAQWFTGASPRTPPQQRRRITSAFRLETVMDKGQDAEPPNQPDSVLMSTTAADESQVPFVPEQTPFLFCDTARTHLFGRLDDYNVATLVTNSGYSVGYLHLHTHHDADLFSNGTDGSALLRIELVAVCKLHIQCLNNTMLERYAVLWVEWKDGVAYRRASGEVDAKAWDDSGPELVSIVLG